MKTILILVLTLSCSVVRSPASKHYLTWSEYLNKEILSVEDLSKIFSDSQFLERWQKSSNIVVDPKSPRPIDLDLRSPNCAKDKFLYPAHPQQDTKEYLYGAYANYTHHKIPVDSSACMTRNPGKTYCLRATYANMVIMSDIYQDGCGNLYRGYWLTSYLKNEESMGTLFSKGKTAYPKLRSEFPGEYEMGGTYKIPKSEFLFFGQLLPNDLKRVQEGRAQAKKFGYRFENLLFLKN